MQTQTLFNQTEVSGFVETLADKIVESISDPVVLVGIREGGDVLAERVAALLRSRGIEFAGIGALDITLYRDDFGHREHWPDVRASEINCDLDGMHVVLIDDVIFTGRTIRAALNALLDYGRPASVTLAVMIDRGQRQLPIQPDIVAVVHTLDRDTLCVAKFKEQGEPEDVVLLAEAN